MTAPARCGSPARCGPPAGRGSQSAAPGDRRQPVDVLYLITELCVVGGAERVLARLLAHLDRDRFRPAVACLYGGNGPIADEIRSLGIPLTDLGMRAAWRWDVRCLASPWRLYAMLRRVRPAILHASLFHANLCGRLLGRLSGVPLVITWRHSVEIGGRWREQINRWTARLDDRAVAVCELVRQAEIVRGGAPAGRVVTVYNGVDVDRFSAKEPQVVERVRRALGIPVDALLLGTVGRHSPEKDLANLLAAMVAVRDHVPTAWLVLVGGGELRGQLETQVRSLGLSDAVVFAGVRDDVPEILAALDLFVLPSRWEGLPLAVLEAMAARLPVVATAVGGVPEVVVDGLTGLLVPPGDPPALAGALLSLARDAGRRRAMGQAGYERVREHFAMAQMARAMERLYEELLAEKRG